MQTRPNRSQLESLYGPITDRWERRDEFMVMYSLPASFWPHMQTPSGIAKHIYCNKDMQLALDKAIHNIIDRGLLDCIKSFGGCWIIRKSRSDERLSVHSYGLALDFNPETNQLGTNGDIDLRLVQAFKDADFVWGGDWKTKDCMHFQYVTED